MNVILNNNKRLNLKDNITNRVMDSFLEELYSARSIYVSQVLEIRNIINLELTNYTEINGSELIICGDVIFNVNDCLLYYKGVSYESFTEKEDHINIAQGIHSIVLHLLNYRVIEDIKNSPGTLLPEDIKYIDSSILYRYVENEMTNTQGNPESGIVEGLYAEKFSELINKIVYGVESKTDKYLKKICFSGVFNSTVYQLQIIKNNHTNEKIVNIVVNDSLYAHYKGKANDSVNIVKAIDSFNTFEVYKFLLLVKESLQGGYNEN